VSCLAFSPDGSRLATGGLDERAEFWDVTTGESVGGLDLVRLVTSVAFSPDGGLLVCGCAEYDTPPQGAVELWRVGADPAESRVNLLRGIEKTYGWPLGPVLALAFAPQRPLLAVGTEFHRVALWDVAAARLLAVLGPAGPVRGLAFAPDGATLAVAAGYSVRLWDVATACELGKVQGQLLQAAASRAEVGNLQGHRGTVTSLSFSRNGRLLATASKDRTVRLWDVADRRERAAFDWEIGQVYAVAFAPDGMTAAAGGKSGKIVIWDIDP
jgi:WD40 repeat protein